MNFMTKLLTDTTLLIGLTPLSPISQIFMDPGTPRQPRCELEHVMTSTVTRGYSSDHYLPGPHAGPASRGGDGGGGGGDSAKTDSAKTGESQKGVRSRISSEYPTLVTRTGAGQCLHLYIY